MKSENTYYDTALVEVAIFQRYPIDGVIIDPPFGREVVPGHWLGTIETFPTHSVYLAGKGKRGLCRVVQRRLCRSTRSPGSRVTGDNGYRL
jgi:hypothetical protein